MSLIFIKLADLKKDFEFSYKITIIENDKKKHIYKYKDELCEVYFKLDDKIQYIGYLVKGVFYVVCLYSQHDDDDDIYDSADFDENYKKHFNFLDESAIILLSKDTRTLTDMEKEKKYEITAQLADLKRVLGNIEYILNIIKYCHYEIDLMPAKEKITKLNELLMLKHRETNTYSISLDYIYNLNKDTRINVFNDSHYSINGSTLLLCIYYENECIASLVIIYNEQTHTISFDSQTKKEFEGRRYNKLLRSLIILLSKTIFSNAETLVSTAQNIVSAYIMIKYFNAVPLDVGDIKFDTNITYKELEDYMTMSNKSYLKVEVKLTPENITTAEELFKSITDITYSDKGGIKKRKLRNSRKKQSTKIKHKNKAQKTKHKKQK
jgi:hypothetical protein